MEPNKDQTQDVSTVPESKSQTTNQLVDLEKSVEVITDMLSTQLTAPSLKDKLKSRKFWIAVAGVVTGILGIVGCRDNVICIVAFALVEVVSIIAYCVSEGHIDSTRTEQLLTNSGKLVEMIVDEIAARKSERDVAADIEQDDDYMADDEITEENAEWYLNDLDTDSGE